MPPWSKKPPLEPEVSPWDWDAEVLCDVKLWQIAALAGLLVVFCCLLCYWQRRANAWATGDRNLGRDHRLRSAEYCLPFDSVFDDVDEDHYTAELENWHEFVKDTCGVKLTVRAVRETDSQS